MKKLANLIQIRIKTLEKDVNIKSLIEKVDKCNYAYDANEYTKEDLKPHGIIKTTFILNVDICTHDTEDKSHCEVMRLSKNQNDWVTEMKCDYVPNVDEIEVSERSEDWDYWDYPALDKGCMYMNIYYRKLPLPNKNEFCCFDENGNLMSIERKRF